MSDVLVSDRAAELAYPGRSVLSGVTGDYRRGDRWILAGPNGAGKSTFLKAVLDPHMVRQGERRVAVSPHRISYMAQSMGSGAAVPCTVRDFLLASYAATAGQRALTAAELRRAEELLERTGLRARAGRLVGELSGGERQRLSFARALYLRSEILLLDEPFAAVDVPSRAALRALLDEMRGGTLQFIVSHDAADLSASSTGVLDIGEGKVHVVPAR